MLDVERASRVIAATVVAAAVVTVAMVGTGRCGTLGQLVARDGEDALEVVVADATEVGGAEAEVDSHRAAVATLVLEVVGAVLVADLSAGDVGASPASEFVRVETVLVQIHLAPNLATVIRLVALVTKIIRVFGKRKLQRFSVKLAALVAFDDVTISQALVLQTLKRFVLHLLLQLAKRS